MSLKNVSNTASQAWKAAMKGENWKNAFPPGSQSLKLAALAFRLFGRVSSLKNTQMCSYLCSTTPNAIKKISRAKVLEEVASKVGNLEFDAVADTINKSAGVLGAPSFFQALAKQEGGAKLLKSCITSLTVVLSLGGEALEESTQIYLGLAKAVLGLKIGHDAPKTEEEKIKKNRDKLNKLASDYAIDMSDVSPKQSEKEQLNAEWKRLFKNCPSVYFSGLIAPALEDGLVAESTEFNPALKAKESLEKFRYNMLRCLTLVGVFMLAVRVIKKYKLMENSERLDIPDSVLKNNIRPLLTNYVLPLTALSICLLDAETKNLETIEQQAHQALTEQQARERRSPDSGRGSRGSRGGGGGRFSAVRGGAAAPRRSPTAEITCRAAQGELPVVVVGGGGRGSRNQLASVPEGGGGGGSSSSAAAPAAPAAAGVVGEGSSSSSSSSSSSNNSDTEDDGSGSS